MPYLQPNLAKTEPQLSAAEQETVGYLWYDANNHVIPAYAAEDLKGLKYSCTGCLNRVASTLKGVRLITENLGPMPETGRGTLWNTMLIGQRKALAEARYGHIFTVLAYFAQTYEEGVRGPGGVIAISKAGQPPPDSAALAVLMWNWRSRETYAPPMPEAEAEAKLWQIMQTEAKQALMWLNNLGHGERRVPAGIRHEIHLLLGVPAWRRVMIQNTGCEAELTALNTIEVRG